ncbi:MAG: outer membrane beta-barrel protein [Rhizobiaceae bacterium]|nr:outer membrane beta-barrel protein [Rhizobiaceae bacterium]
MARSGDRWRDVSRRRAAALLLGASILAVAPAAAQTVPGLRGEVSSPEPVAARAIVALNPGATAAPPPKRYVPVSPGAVADDPPADDASSLFGEVADDRGTFRDADDALSPAEPARPGRAAARRQPGPADAGGGAARAAAPEPLDEAATGGTRTDREPRAERITDDDLGRIEPIEDLDRRPEDNPYDPLGLRVGTFVLRPSIEQGLTATSNADLSPNGRSAVLSETTLRLNAVSDWTRHSATLDAYGTFRKSISGQDYDDTRAGLDGVLNLDLTEDTRARAAIGYARQPETASSPVVIEGTASDPWRQTFSGSLGLEKDLGKARYGITGRVEYDDYADAKLSDGTKLSQRDRNSTLATLVLRGGYQISPALTPFVEAEVGRRFYQEEIDASGYRRSSDRLGLRTGVEVDLGEKLNGELSAGWIRERFDDERLKPVEAPSVSAALTWSPERGTDVNFAASTTVEDTTTADESGSVLHSATVAVTRRIRADLTGNALARVSYRDYSGSSAHDLLLTAEIGATWWLNRYAGITGRLRHESQKSSLEGRDYDANSVFLGLRMQR